MKKYMICMMVVMGCAVGLFGSEKDSFDARLAQERYAREVAVTFANQTSGPLAFLILSHTNPATVKKKESVQAGEQLGTSINHAGMDAWVVDPIEADDERRIRRLEFTRPLFVIFPMRLHKYSRELLLVDAGYDPHVTIKVTEGEGRTLTYVYEANGEEGASAE